MGAKTWMLVYSKGDIKKILAGVPELDRDATTAMVRQLFPSEKLQLLEDGDLSLTCPPDDEIVVGCYPDLVIVAAKEFGIDYPSKLPSNFINAFSDGVLYLHAMHSVVDWFGFGVWTNGTLQRSLSLSPDSGVLEDIGTRHAFESPYWAGSHPAIDPGDDDIEYPFAFHPLELGEAALQAFFGYQLEGAFDPSQIELERIHLMLFKRKKVWWKFS
ncbi:DUF6928 family protein [Massilia sp. S19_KUP03_FR1]|uniref:DUF6928 family protein n=1 Tax=Massilia sp. S19_KUP03_FR1 TaxID=3025503 RepID=UPI002FCD91BF